VRLPTLRTVPSSAGLLLLDARLNPVFVNRTAAQILSYPQDVESFQDCDRELARKVRSLLNPPEASGESAFPSEFRSGRRLYQCRSFQANSAAPGASLIALLFERNAANGVSLRQVAERFRLTAREQGVLELLLQGLTSKEIAAHMEISPNTVKSFLRLIMVKMGVSTRSGIVGKALTSRV